MSCSLVDIYILTVEFAVDLDSGLHCGKAFVPCL